MDVHCRLCEPPVAAYGSDRDHGYDENDDDDDGGGRSLASLPLVTSSRKAVSPLGD